MPVTRPGVMLPGGVRMDEARRLAEESEAAGAEAVWTADTRREPYLLSAAALLGTRTIQVGTNVAVAFSRTPTATAQAAWDLAALSGGRFVLGLGSQVRGTLENRFGVSADHPGPRMRDYIAAVRACWAAYRAGHGRYEGEFYKIRQPVFQPGADSDWPSVPVYLAGVNPVMTEIAGECADGFAAHMFSTPEYLTEVIRPALAVGAARAGREPPLVLLSLTCAPTREMLERQMGAYTVPAYRRVLDHAGFAEQADRILAAIADGRRGDAQRIIEAEVLDSLGTVTLEELEETLGRWRPHADRIALSVPWYGVENGEQVAIFRDLLARLARL